MSNISALRKTLPTCPGALIVIISSSGASLLRPYRPSSSYTPAVQIRAVENLA